MLEGFVLKGIAQFVTPLVLSDYGRRISDSFAREGQKTFLSFLAPKGHVMRQSFHTIIRAEPNGIYVGWVEELPGTLTHGQTLEQCQDNLRDALSLILETNRDEARLALNENCIQGLIEVDVGETVSAG
jgi:predicted RNase H-like HicB family nuclease